VLAAVLVVLYERPGGRGGLRVLLTTRSKELRSHPGQTALPGGKVDKTDAGVVETAVSIILQSLPPFNLIIATMRDMELDFSNCLSFFG
jgi:NUDIX domain